MPLFISYSHEDKEFVDQLAVQLVGNRVHVWLDRWELHVGDSLTSRVEDAITGADALLVILSTASVRSDWCRRELNAGLVRELEERRVVVLPVVVDDCEIPLFLRDKIYADFRGSRDDGLRAILEATARVSNEWQSRVDRPEWHTDWALDWGPILVLEIGVINAVRVTMVEQANDQPYTVMSQILLFSSHDDPQHAPTDQNHAREMFRLLAAKVDSNPDDPVWTFLLQDQFEVTRELAIRGPDSLPVTARLSARRLGEDTGRDVVFHLGQQIQQAARNHEAVMRQGTLETS